MFSRKFLSGILCLAMLFTMFIPVSAIELTETTTGETVVTYGMSEGFLVTIPTNFTIDETAKATANVSASNVMIAHGAVLEVTVSGDDYVGSWELIDGEEPTNTLTYTIGSSEGANDIINNSVVLSIEAGEAYASTVTETLHFTVVDELSKSGTYTDTLTFTVSVNSDISTELSTISGKYISVNDVASSGQDLTVSLSSDAINDFSNIEVIRTGKNILDLNGLSMSYTSNLVVNNKTGVASFVKTSEASSGTASILTNIYLPAGSYTLAFDSLETTFTTGKSISPIIHDTDGNKIANGNMHNGDLDFSFIIEKSGMYKIMICTPFAAPINTNITIHGLRLEMGEASEFEPYTSQTVTANADGTVDGLTSVSPNMTIMTDADVTINLEYVKKN